MTSAANLWRMKLHGHRLMNNAEPLSMAAPSNKIRITEVLLIGLNLLRKTDWRRQRNYHYNNPTPNLFANSMTADGIIPLETDLTAVSWADSIWKMYELQAAWIEIDS